VIWRRFLERVDLKRAAVESTAADRTRLPTEIAYKLNIDFPRRLNIDFPRRLNIDFPRRLNIDLPADEVASPAFQASYLSFKRRESPSRHIPDQ